MAEIPSSGVGQPRSGDPAAPRPLMAGVGAAAWRPWTVGLAFIGALGLALAGRSIVAIGSGGSPGALLAVGIVLTVLNVATVGVALLLGNMRGKPSAADFGLRRPPIGRSIGLTLAVWIGFTVATVLWVSALGLDGEDAQALTDRLGTDGMLAMVILIVVVTVLAPLQEEIVFRGYIFRALRNWRGAWPAATTTGVLFAASHLGWIPIAFMVPIVLFGIGLCLLYHWTGSLYPGIALHAINNSVPLGTALHWTWQTPVLMVCSTLAALTIARLIALRLGDRHPVEATSATG